MKSMRDIYMAVEWPRKREALFVLEPINNKHPSHQIRFHFSFSHSTFCHTVAIKHSKASKFSLFFYLYNFFYADINEEGVKVSLLGSLNKFLYDSWKANNFVHKLQL